MSILKVNNKLLVNTDRKVLKDIKKNISVKGEIKYFIANEKINIGDFVTVESNYVTKYDGLILSGVAGESKKTNEKIKIYMPKENK
jgi:hypothetical protein